jgi:PKD repeat protein
MVSDTSGCVPLTVNLVDTIQNAKLYLEFGDGTPDFQRQMLKNHEYTQLEITGSH